MDFHFSLHTQENGLIRIFNLHLGSYHCRTAGVGGRHPVDLAHLTLIVFSCNVDLRLLPYSNLIQIILGNSDLHLDLLRTLHSQQLLPFLRCGTFHDLHLRDNAVKV